MSVVKNPATLGSSATIRDALSLLNSAEPKLCLVVDDAGRLLRTISDGDIRRSLLEGASLASPVSDLKGSTPVCAPLATSKQDLLQILDKEKVTSIVLVDDEMLPQDVVGLSDLTEMVLLSPPHLGAAETGYVQDAFETNWIAPAGPNLTKFEAALCDVCARKKAIAVSSGTAGLHLALRALNLPADTSIYVSDKTFAASVQPVLYEHFTPIFIDSEPESWNMSPAALEHRFKEDAARDTLPGAVIVVHLYGQSADLGNILPLCQAYNVPLIEDAAESLGAFYGNRPSGSHGLISVFSFNGNKIITTSGGGAVVTDDPDIAAQIRSLSTQGRDPFDHYQHAQVAYNYRMSNILAGVGLGQLEVLTSRVQRRRTIFDRYKAALSHLQGVGLQNEVAGSLGNRWLSVITLDPDYIDVHPYQVMRQLRSKGIETRPSWKPMHMQPLFLNAEFVPHSQTEAVSSELFLRSLCLPSGSSLTDAQQDHIIEHVSAILQGSPS